MLPDVQIGGMSAICQFCSAHKKKKEVSGKLQDSAVQMVRSNCLLRDPPPPLNSLLTGSTMESKQSLDNPRRYNSAFQMTSFGANIIQKGGFMPTFKVQG